MGPLQKFWLIRIAALKISTGCSSDAQITLVLISGSQAEKFSTAKFFPGNLFKLTGGHGNQYFLSLGKEKRILMYWTWKHCFLSVKYQVERLKSHDCRIFHITDSYICMSIVSKGRSSSKQLQRVLRRLTATLLAHGLHLVIAHVESTENPTDFMSRHC